MKSLLLVGIGGAIGAVLRHGAGVAATSWLGRGFPIGTLAVNVVGSLVLGAVLGWSERAALGPEARLLVGTGLCGALTTFSTFSTETLALLQSGQRGAAAANVLLNVGLGLGAAAAGLSLARG